MVRRSKRTSKQFKLLVLAYGPAWFRVEYISPVLFSLYANDVSTLSHHVELAL
jgi:hypothetical protein